MIYAIKVLQWFFTIYTILLFIRVFSSWVPQYHNHKVVRLSRFYTDPYLNIFKRVLPPVGGVFDLSPIVGFFALSLIEKLLLRFLSVFL